MGTNLTKNIIRFGEELPDLSADKLVNLYHSTEQLKQAANKIQPEIGSSQRLALWKAIQAGYCKHCGDIDTDNSCQCMMRDERST